MGAGEEGTPTKHSKPTSAVQEAQAPPSYPDWASSMQAYYGAGAAPAFYASTVAPPTPHPYMWGGQHPLMSPYGTPVPYPAMYPPGGIYAHPSIATNPTVVPTGESEGKTSEGKERNPTKKSKGASGNASLGGGKTGDIGKAASSSGNDGGTQSAESDSDGSSDGSDENTNHEYSAGKKGSFHQMLADGASAQNISAGGGLQSSVAVNPVASVPTANLNIGMDLWNASPAGNGSLTVRSNTSGAVTPGAMIAHDGMMPDQWDERELKRQKRKQSNRESARRSRLRKQAECEELQGRVEVLNDENRTLRDELKRLSEECEKITSENNTIKEELIKVYGPDEVSRLGIQTLDDGGDS